MALFYFAQLSIALYRVFIGLDNQAVIRALSDQNLKSGHFLLDEIHQVAKALRDKQIRNHGSFDLQIHWVPGHAGLEGNEIADQHAKEGAAGRQSLPNKLPILLRKPLPHSASAIKASTKKITRDCWARRWQSSKQYKRIRNYNRSLPSPKFMLATSNIPRNTASLIIQLHTNHIALNHHLHRIGKADSPDCPGCDTGIVETIDHVLLECPMYRTARKTLRDRFGTTTLSTFSPLHVLGRFSQPFSDPLGAFPPSDFNFYNPSKSSNFITTKNPMSSHLQRCTQSTYGSHNSLPAQRAAACSLIN
jgi:hypothetical protein